MGNITRRLRKDARKSAKARGHQLGKFSPLAGLGWNISSYSSCVVCGREVSVSPTPPPNGIDISGEALAVGCDA
jgi:hypothetical protein